MTRHQVGRPQARWEDVLCGFSDVDWCAKACADKDSWKLGLKDFVRFGWMSADSKFKLKNDADGALIKRMLKPMKDDKFEAPEVDQDEALFRWDVRPCSEIGVRLELLGDSNLIVNWTNAIWPMNNFQQQLIVSNAQTKLWKWHADLGVLPRRNCEDWLRHVPRELNTNCDALAHCADDMDRHDLIVDFKNYDISSKFIVGKWDGGYIEGKDTVTIGFCVDEIEIEDNDASRKGKTIGRVVSGYGRCPGNSAIKAELCAFDCLIHTLDFLFSKTNGKYVQWSAPPAFSERLF